MKLRIFDNRKLVRPAKWFFYVIILVLSGYSVEGQQFSPGTKYFGYRNFIEYTAGNLPVVLAAPHGGYARPDDIPDRNCSNCSGVTDAFTLELTNEIAEALYKKSGCFPHTIINNLHRIKLDANRDVEEAALGNSEAQKAWQDFHNFIELSKATIESNFEKGIFLDIHGHGHTIQRIELGYLLYDDELRLPDHTLNSPTYVGYSSIRNLVNYNRQQLSHADLLKGQMSFGHYLDLPGYPAVPSFNIPFPLSNQPYFSGGYNTARHGSWKSGSIDGIQVECNQQIRFNADIRKKFAEDFAEVIMQYLEAHYFEDFRNYSCLTSVNNIALDKINSVKIVPNPASNTISIQLSEIIHPLKIHIRNSTGMIVAIIYGNGDSADVSQLTPGLYFVEIISDETTWFTKFIKV